MVGESPRMYTLVVKWLAPKFWINSSYAPFVEVTLLHEGVGLTRPLRLGEVGELATGFKVGEGPIIPIPIGCRKGLGC